MSSHVPCAAMSQNNTSSALRNFILIGRAEAVSYLVLLAIAMPLKYFAGMLWAVKVVGWAHGVLFMVYMASLLWVAYRLKWDVLKIIYGFIAALLPFGPFVFERSLRNTSP